MLLWVVAVQLIWIFLLLVRQSQKRKQIEYLEKKLARLSATDDEVMCILEATDTPLAKRLLSYAKKPTQKALPPSMTAVVSTVPRKTRGKWVSGTQWRAFRKEMKANKSDGSKLAVVRDWIECGLSFNASHQASIAVLLRSDMARDIARKMFAQQ